jgi:hypothetical protein
MRRRRKINIVLFYHTLKTKSTHPLLGAWSLLLVHVRFPPSERPKALQSWIFPINLTMMEV